MSSKPLSAAEKSLLQKGPTFAITPTTPPIIDYIAANKHICKTLGENAPTIKTDSVEYCTKVKNVLTNYSKRSKLIKSNITKEEKEVLHNLKKDDNYMILTADKGVELIIMDKDTYKEKCVTLLSEQRVYTRVQGH